MLEFVVWVLFGTLAGWIIALLLRTETQRKTTAYMTTGVFGAIIGGWLTYGMTGGHSQVEFNYASVLVATFGAVLFIGLFELFQRTDDYKVKFK